MSIDTHNHSPTGFQRIDQHIISLIDVGNMIDGIQAEDPVEGSCWFEIFKTRSNEFYVWIIPLRKMIELGFVFIKQMGQ